MYTGDPRKNLRLQKYNYSSFGYYFITICTQNKQHWFGQITDQTMTSNQFGQIVTTCWFDLPKHYGNCQLDEFILMPNHVHGIIILDNEYNPTADRTGFKPVPTTKKTNTPRLHGLSEIIRAFKSFSSRRINEKSPLQSFKWQRSYYDHIVRDDHSLEHIRHYIRCNPFNWPTDAENQTH